MTRSVAGKTPRQTHWLTRLRWLPDRLPGRLSDSQIAGKHPSGADRRACRANPLGQPAGPCAGRTFCDPRTSCGRTIGRTIALLNRARVGRILGDNRSTRWLDLFPSAPFPVNAGFKTASWQGCACVSGPVFQALCVGQHRDLSLIHI